MSCFLRLPSLAKILSLFTINNAIKISDIKIKGNDREEISTHQTILVSHSDVFKSMLLNEMKEATPDIIEFSEFSLNILCVILEYLYTEKTLTIEIVAKVFHGADFFLLEQLKFLFVTNYLSNAENKINISAKVLSQLSEYINMDSSNDEFCKLLCNSINSGPLKSIEYYNLNTKVLEYILSNIKKEESEMFTTSDYELFRYVTL